MAMQFGNDEAAEIAKRHNWVQTRPTPRKPSELPEIVKLCARAPPQAGAQAKEASVYAAERIIARISNSQSGASQRTPAKSFGIGGGSIVDAAVGTRLLDAAFSTLSGGSATFIPPDPSETVVVEVLLPRPPHGSALAAGWEVVRDPSNDPTARSLRGVARLYMPTTPRSVGGEAAVPVDQLCIVGSWDLAGGVEGGAEAQVGNTLRSLVTDAGPVLDGSVLRTFIERFHEESEAIRGKPCATTVEEDLRAVMTSAGKCIQAPPVVGQGSTLGPLPSLTGAGGSSALRTSSINSNGRAAAGGLSSGELRGTVAAGAGAPPSARPLPRRSAHKGLTFASCTRQRNVLGGEGNVRVYYESPCDLAAGHVAFMETVTSITPYRALDESLRSFWSLERRDGCSDKWRPAFTDGPMAMGGVVETRWILRFVGKVSASQCTSADLQSIVATACNMAAGLDRAPKSVLDETAPQGPAKRSAPATAVASPAPLTGSAS